MPQIKELISLKLTGNYFEHFVCSEKRLNKIESMMKSVPNKRTQFIEIDKCKFEYPYEPQILFNFMLNPNIFKDLRYVTIQKCKLNKSFITQQLISYLNEDENMVRFAFVLNQAPQI